MPRQDVPYGGAICRLKERLAEIWDKLGEKLHSINGVEGDAAGNVEIVSGDAAITITDDQVNHQITIGLDQAELPAAAVSSVNGQTGAVALTADDIPSDNGDVQTDLDTLASADTTLQGNINAEALARQGADATLQTNINTLSASLPSAAAAAVAADPTVAQLVVDLGNKVDLSDVSTVETPDTIAKRNGSGRLVAADPASGATDKTLVTANWVSQTGAGRPNNVLHDSGNETIDGVKTLTGRINGLSNINNGRMYAYHGSGDYWRKKINILQDVSWCGIFILKSAVCRGINGTAIFVYHRRASSSEQIEWIFRSTGNTMQVGIAADGIYVYQNGSDGVSIELLGEISSQIAANTIISMSDDSVLADPSVLRTVLT